MQSVASPAYRGNGENNENNENNDNGNDRNNRNNGTDRVLHGTLPVRPFHPNGFFGTLQVDGQLPRVTALVCSELNVVAISLVGYDTSVSAALAKLWQYEQVTFHLADGIEWSGPLQLARRSEGYKQFSAKLQGTKEVHTIALPLSAHIAEGILHPLDLPKPSEEEEEERGERGQEEGKNMQQKGNGATSSTPSTSSNGSSRPSTVSTTKVKVVDRSRIVLGNWHEDAPHQRSFLGQLYAMRVIFLHRNAEHPEWADIWAEELWKRGLTRQLVKPLKSLGIKAWLLSGDVLAWGQLIGDGVRTGWLPWRATLPS